MGETGNRDDLYGIEWDFLVHDLDGSIALLSTAGAATIPLAVLSKRVLVERAVDALRGLPVLGESVDLRPMDRLTGDYSDWFELSKRGLFTYDWRLHRGPYDPVSAPTILLSVAEADPVIAEAAGLHGLPISFADAMQIHLDEPDR